MARAQPCAGPWGQEEEKPNLNPNPNHYPNPNPDFLFNGEIYLQVHGTAMGKVYANLYMAGWEQEALTKCRFRPTIYLRFLDDIFGLFPFGTEEFGRFEQVLNSHHPTIKVTSTVSMERIDFLDTVVFVTQGAPGGR